MRWLRIVAFVLRTQGFAREAAAFSDSGRLEAAASEGCDGNAPTVPKTTRYAAVLTDADVREPWKRELSPSRVLGQGARGKVIEAGIRRCPGVSVAVKVQWPLHDCGTTPAGDQWPQCRDAKCCEQFQEKMEREVRAMQLFRSERFIQLLDYGVGPIAEDLGSGLVATYARIRPYGPANRGAVAYSMMTVQEHAVLGEVLKKGKPLSFTQRVLYLWQAADAMAEMHAKGAIHDDFHAYNIFLRCDQSAAVDAGEEKLAQAELHDGEPLCRLRIADLGQACAIWQHSSLTPCGCFHSDASYRPSYYGPETYAAHQFSNEVWGLGHLAAKLFPGLVGVHRGALKQGDDGVGIRWDGTQVRVLRARDIKDRSFFAETDSYKHYHTTEELAAKGYQVSFDELSLETESTQALERQLRRFPRANGTRSLLDPEAFVATAGNWDAVWALEAAKLAESDAGLEHLPRRSLAAAQKIRDAVVSTLQIDVLEQRDPEVTDEVWRLRLGVVTARADCRDCSREPRLKYVWSREIQGPEGSARARRATAREVERELYAALELVGELVEQRFGLAVADLVAAPVNDPDPKLTACWSPSPTPLSRLPDSYRCEDLGIEREAPEERRGSFAPALGLAFVALVFGVH
jgi:serine/threonine protein kinase